MKPNQPTFEPEFKKHVVLEVLNSGNPHHLDPIAMKYGVSPNAVRQWKTLYLQYGDNAFDPKKRKALRKDKIKELEKRNAELEEEIEILKKAAAFLADAGRK